MRYLANHSLSCETNVHDELVTREGSCGANPYATVGGKAAANNSNITRVNAQVPDRVAVTNWFVSAFHALTLLDPRLRAPATPPTSRSAPTGAQPDAVQVHRRRRRLPRPDRQLQRPDGGLPGHRRRLPAAVLPGRHRVTGAVPLHGTVIALPLLGQPAHGVGADHHAVAAGSRAPQTPASIVDLSTGRCCRPAR